MTYTIVENGLTLYSNVPFDTAPQGGNLITIDIKYQYPIAYLEAIGYSVLNAFGQGTVEAQLLTQLGYNVHLLNYNVFALDAYTERLAFVAPAPASAAAIGPFAIAAMTIVAIGIAVAVIAAAVGLVALAAYATINLAVAVAPLGGPLLIILGGIAVIGAVAFTYDFLKEKGFRKEVYRGVGRTAKGAVKGGAELAVGGARSAAGAGLSLARIQQQERESEEERKRGERESRAERRTMERVARYGGARGAGIG